MVNSNLSMMCTTEYDSMENQFWSCSFCRENDMTDINHSSEKFLLRYFDDIVRTVRGDTIELLDAVNNLHLYLTFLDMSINVNVQPEGTIVCTWYRKPSDTGTILNYRSCSPLQHKKSIIQGTKHRLFRCTNNWEVFHVCVKRIKKMY